MLPPIESPRNDLMEFIDLLTRMRLPSLETASAFKSLRLLEGHVVQLLILIYI